MKLRYIIVLIFVILIFGIGILLLNNTDERTINNAYNEKSYEAYVNISSSDVEFVKISFYRNDATMYSTYYIKYKTLGICTSANGTVMNCSNFEKFKGYKKRG